MALVHLLLLYSFFSVDFHPGPGSIESPYFNSLDLRSFKWVEKNVKWNLTLQINRVLL